MSPGDAWSPDEPEGTETFEQGDEAFDEEVRMNPNYAEAVQLDPSLDPATEVDELELAEAGLELDDPEMLAMLPGGGDDPDGAVYMPTKGSGAVPTEQSPDETQGTV